ncbi:hypothetical protein GRF29_154g387368, partial [Pseudopithomyces chartarum]
MNKPDLVISIDFGTTCTGVAYCNVATGTDIVRHIQKWPGRLQANEDKVPTILVYPNGSNSPSHWGFQAETAQDQSGIEDETREWFKIWLDEDLAQQARRTAKDPSKIPSLQEVEKWYCDYFQLLYRSIEARLRGEVASRWEDANIEFIFSVPTTWKPNPTVERFRKLAERAGFGKSPSHSVVIGLTEAEAAAVHTARNTPAMFKENDILFVCDVGGGTTDLSVFRVKNASSGGNLSLEQVDVVFGANIGSTKLDDLFESAVNKRLHAADCSVPMGLPNLGEVAWRMRISRQYQNAKCEYGSEDSSAFTDTFGICIPGLDRRYSNEAHGISNGEMEISRNDLKSFFDTQVSTLPQPPPPSNPHPQLSKLYTLIDKQLHRVHQKFPYESVSHLVLSGGLGNSAYVRDSLITRYAQGRSAHPSAQNLQIRVAPEPQLVVCKGNVADRVQKLKSGQAVLGWRCSRASYGTLCKVLYDAEDARYFGAPTQVDPLDGKTYVMQHVDWFVKQGEPVSSSTPIVRTFKRKCSPATPSNPDPPRIFPTEIITSDLEASLLPTVMNASCHSICRIDSDFSLLPLSTFKLKNRHWWNTGKKYHRIDFVVKVDIGPADMSFELWHQGVKLSKDSSIKVEWHAAPAPAPVPRRPLQMDPEFDM